MKGTAACVSAGVTVTVQSALPWVRRLLDEASAGELLGVDAGASLPAGRPEVRVVVEEVARPFDTVGAEPLTRGAWRRGREVVLADAASSGFDLLVVPAGQRLVVRARWRPPVAGAAAAWMLRSRFHLLARAALLHYPALWWAGVHGLAPLHASGVRVAGDSGATFLLAGPGGVGKSTLLRAELGAGGAATSDNLCTSDGRTVHGLLEPLRTAGGSGRRMPHGRRESPWSPWAHRAAALEPDRVLVVRRGAGDRPVLRDVDPQVAHRALVAGTFAAGELRRYWAFAATLALGTGAGPAEPAVTDAARRLVTDLPCVEVLLPRSPGVRLCDLARAAVTR